MISYLVRGGVFAIETVPQIFSIRESGKLAVLGTDRFKSGLLTVTALLPVTPTSACLGPLLLSVLRRGTERYPSLAAINRRLDDLYGTGFSVRPAYQGDRLALTFAAELLDERYLPSPVGLLSGAAELIGQMLFHPLLDADGCLCEPYVQREKELQRDAIRGLKNDPRTYASVRLSRLLYRGEPAGVPLLGTEEQVMAVTARELTDFWQSLKDSFAPVCLSVGSLPAERILPALEENFRFPGATVLSCYEKDPPLFAKEIQRVEEPMDISQGILLLGYRAGTFAGRPDSIACAVMTELLGGSGSSRLFVNVRERSSLCYSVGASYRASRGTVVVNCALRPDNREIAEEKILAEVAAVQNGNFSDDELDTAKKTMLNLSRQTRDSAAGLEEFYRRRILRADDGTIEDQQRRIAAVGRAEVIAAARALTLDTVYFLRGTRTGGETDENDEI